MLSVAVPAVLSPLNILSLIVMFPLELGLTGATVPTKLPNIGPIKPPEPAAVWVLIVPLYKQFVGHAWCPFILPTIPPLEKL